MDRGLDQQRQQMMIAALMQHRQAGQGAPQQAAPQQPQWPWAPQQAPQQVSPIQPWGPWGPK